MYVLGHVGISLLLYAPIAAWTVSTGQPTLAVLTGVLMMVLSPLPDFDIYTDRIAHRGPTHTVWFALAVGFIVGIAAGLLVQLSVPSSLQLSPLWAAGWFGSIAVATICGHLAGDLITPMGIRPFRPLSTYHRSLDLTSSKSSRANRLWFGVGIVVLVSSLLFVVA